ACRSRTPACPSRWPWRAAAGPAILDAMESSADQIQTLVILGGTGDLAGRLLLPGLGRLLASGRAEHLRLVGAGVEPWDNDRWRERLVEAFGVAPSIEVPPWERVAPRP